MSDLLSFSRYQTIYFYKGEERNTKIQKFGYLEDKKKNFFDEIKIISHNYLGAIIWWKKKKNKL